MFWLAIPSSVASLMKNEMRLSTLSILSNHILRVIAFKCIQPNAWEEKLFVQMLVSAVIGVVRARIKLDNEEAVEGAEKKNYCVHYNNYLKLLAKLNNICMSCFMKEGFLMS